MNPIHRYLPGWVVTYKLYHIPFWLLYHYAWWTVAMGNPLKAADNILFSTQSLTFSFYVVFQAAAVYLNLYFLVPRYLYQKQFLKYVMFTAILLISTAGIIVGGYYFSALLFGIQLKSLYTNGADCFFFFFGQAFPSTVASSTLALSIKLALHTKTPSGDKPDGEHKNYFFVKDGSKFEKILFDDILYIEGMQNYVTVYTTKTKYVALLKMKNLERDLAEKGFIRIHKSYIVSLQKVSSLGKGSVVVAGVRIPISRSYRKSSVDNLLTQGLPVKG